MRKIMILLFTTGVTMWQSCSHGGNHKDSTGDDKAVHEETLDDQLQLNEGDRWAANVETNQGIMNMKSLVMAYRDSDQENTSDLGRNLQDEYDEIIRRCTMKGEAHNQLHIFLVPLSRLIVAFTECDADCDQFVEETERHLKLYDEFFE